MALTALALQTAVWPLTVCHDKSLFIARMIDQNCAKGHATGTRQAEVTTRRQQEET
jgi:hypothetical protein